MDINSVLQIETTKQPSTMSTVRNWFPFFIMHKDIFNGCENGKMFGTRTIAIYAFVCFKDGIVNKDDILKAFPGSTIRQIENSLFVLQEHRLITIENQ